MLISLILATIHEATIVFCGKLMKIIKYNSTIIIYHSVHHYLLGVIMLWQLITGWLNYTKLHASHIISDGESGQGLVEYALILILVSVVMVILLVVLGPGIQNMYSNILDQINNVQS